MDLCCGTGLLAQRMHVELGMNVVGVDSNPKSIALALDAGVLVPLVHTKITPATLPGLVQLTETRRVEAVVARRCFPELFDQSHDFGRDFLNRMHAAGVHELVLEGRVRVQNARNSLPGIEEEISLALSAGWSLKARHKNCAYMVIA
jgi:SAM-dependent methyltransferase